MTHFLVEPVGEKPRATVSTFDQHHEGFCEFLHDFLRVMVENVSPQISLTVDNPQKVLLMGEAQDFGTCKAAKKNGDPCSQIVNLVRPSASSCDLAAVR